MKKRCINDNGVYKVGKNCLKTVKAILAKCIDGNEL